MTEGDCLHIDELKKVLDEQGIDLFATFDAVTRRFFTGFGSSDGLFIVKGGCARLFVDSRYIEAAGKEARGVEVELAGKGFFNALRDMGSDGVRCVGYEEDRLSVELFEKLNSLFPNARTKPVGRLIKRLRMKKTDEEIRRIEAAQELSERGFEHILGYIAEGVSEREIAAEMEYFLRKNGADGVAFDTIILSGAKTSMPHGVPDGNTVKSGDFVLMDFGARLDGWCADMTRTVAVGRADDEMKRVYDSVYRAHMAVFESARAGMSGREIDAIARDIIKKEGYGEMFGHALGHGTGLEVHEEPRFSPAYDEPIEDGCVISVEPGVYIPGRFGVRIEDLSVMSGGRLRSLNRTEKKLTVL